MNYNNVYNKYIDAKSSKLQKQIDAQLNKPIAPGDVVKIKGKFLKRNSSQDSEYVNSVKVKDVKDGIVEVYNGYKPEDTCHVDYRNCTQNTFSIGANPFVEDNWRSRLRVSNRDMHSLLGLLFPLSEFEADCLDGQKRVMPNICWNPFIINKDGNREYYQRDLVWKKKDKQLLIESIYNNLDCGMFVFRKRKFSFVEEQFAKGNYGAAFHDIVDGKQRLDAIRGFVIGEFPDLHGNYFTDFSEYARRKFEDFTCFSYAELDDDATDSEVIRTFLNVNFTGVKMSKEHIAFVKEINTRL